MKYELADVMTAGEAEKIWSIKVDTLKKVQGSGDIHLDLRKRNAENPGNWLVPVRAWSACTVLKRNEVQKGVVQCGSFFVQKYFINPRMSMGMSFLRFLLK